MDSAASTAEIRYFDLAGEEVFYPDGEGVDLSGLAMGEHLAGERAQRTRQALESAAASAAASASDEDDDEVITCPKSQIQLVIALREAWCARSHLIFVGAPPHKTPASEDLSDLLGEWDRCEYTPSAKDLKRGAQTFLVTAYNTLEQGQDYPTFERININYNRHDPAEQYEYTRDRPSPDGWAPDPSTSLEAHRAILFGPVNRLDDETEVLRKKYMDPIIASGILNGVEAIQGATHIREAGEPPMNGLHIEHDASNLTGEVREYMACQDKWGRLVWTKWHSPPQE